MVPLSLLKVWSQTPQLSTILLPLGPAEVTHSSSNNTQTVERVSFTSQLESSSRFHLNHKTVDLITVIICLKVSSFPCFLQTLLISDCSAHKPYPVFFNRYIVFLNTFKEQSLTKSSPLCWTRQTQLNFLTKRMVKDGVVYLLVSCGEKCRTSYNELVQKHLEQEEADLPAITCLGNTFSIHTVRLRITQQLHFRCTFNWLLHQVWTESTNGLLSSIIHITNKIRWPFRGSRGKKRANQSLVELQGQLSEAQVEAFSIIFYQIPSETEEITLSALQLNHFLQNEAVANCSATW